MCFEYLDQIGYIRCGGPGKLQFRFVTPPAFDYLCIHEPTAAGYTQGAGRRIAALAGSLPVRRQERHDHLRRQGQVPAQACLVVFRAEPRPHAQGAGAREADSRDTPLRR